MPETRRRPQGMYGMEADEVRFILRSLGLSDVANAHGFPVGGIQEFYGLRRYRVERGSGIAGRGTLWALVEIGSGERIGPRCSKPTELKRLLTEWMAGPKPNHPGRWYARLHHQTWGDSWIWVGILSKQVHDAGTTLTDLPDAGTAICSPLR